MEARILVGNVGTGKSFYARKETSGNPNWICWNNDAFSEMLHCGEYVYDPVLLPIIRGAFKDLVRRIVPNYNIIVDCTNINGIKRKSMVTMIRNVLKEKILAENLYDMTCINFGPGDRMSLERRLNDPRGQSAETWIGVHEKFRTSYETPDESEGFTTILRI